MWLRNSKKLGLKSAVLAIGLLLFGAAMTMSRTVWLNLLLLGIVGLTRKTALISQREKFYIAISIGYFISSVFFVRWFTIFYWQADPQIDWLDLTTVGSASRPAIWTFFIDAARQQLLWGYGWNQTGYVHMTLALALHAFDLPE